MLRAGLVLSPLLSGSSFLPSLTCCSAGTQPTALALLTCTHPGAGRRPSLVPCPSFRPLPAQHSSRPFCSSLRPLDIEFMKRLSKVVNIVPVIAKADTLTLEERVYFKQRVGLSTFLLAGAVRHSTPGFSWRRKIRNGWSPLGAGGGRWPHLPSLPCGPTSGCCRAGGCALGCCFHTATRQNHLENRGAGAPQSLRPSGRERGGPSV